MKIYFMNGWYNLLGHPALTRHTPHSFAGLYQVDLTRTRTQVCETDTGDPKLGGDGTRVAARMRTLLRLAPSMARSQQTRDKQSCSPQQSGPGAKPATRRRAHHQPGLASPLPATCRRRRKLEEGAQQRAAASRAVTRPGRLRFQAQRPGRAAHSTAIARTAEASSPHLPLSLEVVNDGQGNRFRTVP